MTSCRLLRYSTQDETRSLFPKRIYSSTRWQYVDYHVLNLWRDKISIFQEGIIIHRDKDQSTTMARLAHKARELLCHKVAPARSSFSNDLSSCSVPHCHSHTRGLMPIQWHLHATISDPYFQILGFRFKAWGLRDTFHWLLVLQNFWRIKEKKIWPSVWFFDST